MSQYLGTDHVKITHIFMSAKESLSERKELPNPTHIIFFDMDDTVWEMIGEEGADEWLSKGTKTNEDKLTFVLDEITGLVRRENDGVRIRLKEGAIETLTKLSEMGIPLGIVSDNRRQDVETVASIFGIWNFFHPNLTHIKLYDDAVDGPCNKGLVIKDLLGAFTANGAISHVLFIDDKAKYRERTEFSAPLANQRIQFVQSPKSTFPHKEIMNFAVGK